ncbi:Uncharacterized protein DAT39_003346, partial [Clarias magur]
EKHMKPIRHRTYFLSEDSMKSSLESPFPPGLPTTRSQSMMDHGRSRRAQDLVFALELDPKLGLIILINLWNRPWRTSFE